MRKGKKGFRKRLLFLCVPGFLLLTIILSCSKEENGPPDGHERYLDTLFVDVDEGIWGWPDAGWHVFGHLHKIEYIYALNPGAIDLRVLLDGEDIPNSGVIVIDRNRFLEARCENKVIWKLPLEKHVYYCCPAVSDDGTIYVTTGMVFQDYDTGSLYAVSPNGTVLWSYGFENLEPRELPNLPYSPAIGNDGTIYVQDYEFRVYAFTPSGELKWRFDDFGVGQERIVHYDTGQRVPAIGYDGTVYIAANGLYALDPESGEKIWRFYPFPTEGRSCRNSPVIAPDGTIYITIHQDDFFAVNPDGTQKWHAKLDFIEEQTFGCPAIGSDGTIYIGTERFQNGFVYAFNSDGTKRWKYEIDGLGRVVRASPTISEDGTIYVATKAGVGFPALVIALSPEGNRIWEYVVEPTSGPSPDDVYCTPSVGADGLIYFGAETQRFYCLKPDGRLYWSTQIEYGLNWSSGSIIADGTLYIGTHHENRPNRGNLYALRTSSHGYAQSPWPRFRKDNKNTGRF
ncbi:MAG: outer membrane protein assembly factor BamB family protein [bacterium]